MTDPRYNKLADLLIHHSTQLQAGEHLLIEAFDIPQAMVIALVRAAKAVGGHPHVAIRDTRIMRELVNEAGDEQLAVWSEIDLNRMKQMQAYIGLRGSGNISEMSGISDEGMKAFGSVYQTPVHIQQRVRQTKWCVLRWPSASMAQLAEQNTEAFEDFYFKVCTTDYQQMAKAVEPLKQAMEQADQVRIQGPGDTDLSFSIKDIPVVPCVGRRNIPDGECFTAPVKESVNGIMHYNTPSQYQGKAFKNVRFEFKDGRIVNATADQGEEYLQAILDTDDGARYIGEFSLGFHPHILHPMNDTLFDEKIAGSLHLTPGQAYQEAYNGNDSQVHWDMVLIQRADYGGGTIHFDGELFRKNGLFIPEALHALNP